jgi:hypothetical protein
MLDAVKRNYLHRDRRVSYTAVAPPLSHARYQALLYF